MGSFICRNVLFQEGQMGPIFYVNLDKEKLKWVLFHVKLDKIYVTGG